MKLNKIKIRNFMEIKSADIDLSGATIHCFVGSKGSGQSTIRDGVEWCLLGTCRRLKTKDQLPAIVRNGQKKAIVEVITDLSHFKRSRTRKTTDRGVGLNPEISDDLLRIVLDSYDFLNRAHDSQKLLLKHVLGLGKPGIVLTEPNEYFTNREGLTCRLADIDRAQAKKQLSKLKTEKDALLFKKGEAGTSNNLDAEYLKKTVERLESQLKDLSKGKDPEKFRKQIAELETDIETFEALKKNLNEISEEASKKIQEHDDHIEGQRYLINKKKGALKDAETTERQRNFTADELKKAKEALKKAETAPKKQGLDIDEIDSQIEAIDAQIINGDALVDKEITLQGLAKINDRIKAVGLLDVVINEDLRPVLNNCPLPSKTEKFRIGVVIQEAISFLTGTRLLFVDKADILDPDNRSFLIQSLYKVRNDYDTIMVFSTVGDKEVLPSPVPDVQMWSVDGGRVSQINKEA